MLRWDGPSTGNCVHAESNADAAATAGNAHAFECLDALLLAFLDAHVHADRVTGTERRDVLLEHRAGPQARLLLRADRTAATTPTYYGDAWAALGATMLAPADAAVNVVRTSTHSVTSATWGATPTTTSSGTTNPPPSG